MITNEILVCIANHNNNENAINLKNKFSKYFETIIIDSKSNVINENFDIKLENVYYSGLVNESINQCKIRKKNYLFFIASDVYYDDCEIVKKIIESLDSDIYLWSPSSKGQSHQHCKNFKSNTLRDVPYIEGFCFLAHINCFNNLYPISLEKNLYGYGIDLLLGYNCIKILKKRCVIDDRIEIYHKEGTGYNQNYALQMMYDWMLYNFDSNVRNYTILYSKSPGYKKLLEYLES